MAVIFELLPHPGQAAGYFELAASLREQLMQVDGFVSVARYQNLAEPGQFLSLSYWRDEAAVQAWRRQVGHRAAQAQGRSALLADYRIRVAKVLRDYTLSQRDEAPPDSNACLPAAREAPAPRP